MYQRFICSETLVVQHYSTYLVSLLLLGAPFWIRPALVYVRITVQHKHIDRVTFSHWIQGYYWVCLLPFIPASKEALTVE